MKSTYEAYYEATQSVKDVVDSGFIGNFVERILSTSDSLNVKPKVIIACTRNFLSITSTEELVHELKSLNIDDTTIRALVSENINIITGIEKSNLQANIHTELSSQIIEAEAAIATLPTIRTMNQTEPVYSSTQAAILREGGEIGAGSATLKTHPSEAPTWDSAR